ncbi:hypothetical protein ACTI_24910 [Actinoplanes sp. OR16]|uniref:response regulator transcription factor n=1 Tax=Actinoplanes sp. OR16 TaxID=946334 RepID=UPI000F6E1269|nr:response regulator [Actinoplanes sp. OR16]BBH65806.1 hypothetical protein ACTI_24910 [Actinoplanes sp. OR16]
MPTVLIADDEVDHRDLLALALRRLGHTVVTAGDAEEALAVLAGGEVDVALIDVRMPGESGVELCRRLRRDLRTESLPIMMISADVQHHQVMTALHAGADDYLAKPFSRAELGSRLEDLMRRSPAPALRSTAAARAAATAARQTLWMKQRTVELRRTA